MKICQILLIVFVFSSTLFAQSVKVISTEKLNIPVGFNPQFTEGDSKIIFTKSNYKGLYSFDIDSEKLSIISSENGAGYRPLITGTGKIIFRTTKFNKGRKFHTLRSIDLKTNKEELLTSEKRLLKLPYQMIANDYLFIENSKVVKKQIEDNSLTKSNSPSKAIYTEKNKLILIDGKQVKELSPLGEGVYVWASISNKQDKILFSYGNKGSFICDLTGKVLQEIKNARYPKFSPNDEYVSYMIDKDDGKNFTSSDIFVYSISTGNSTRITNTENKIEMFANWSRDGGKLVFHTTDGEILMTKLEFQN